MKWYVTGVTFKCSSCTGRAKQNHQTLGTANIRPAVHSKRKVRISIMWFIIDSTCSFINFENRKYSLSLIITYVQWYPHR